VRAADEATRDLRERAGNALGTAADNLGKAWNGTGKDPQAPAQKPTSLAEKILGKPSDKGNTPPKA
jgi:hypothetical protein